MELDTYSRRRPELPPFAGPPGGPPGGELAFMGAPGAAPAPMPVPHPQQMMPMARPPHPSEISWQQHPRVAPDPRYYPPSEEYSSDSELDDGQVGPGRRYIGMKDHRDRMWTEITKDLVVRDAVERFGYEYEETDSFFYIFSYLHYVRLFSVPVSGNCINRLMANTTMYYRRMWQPWSNCLTKFATPVAVASMKLTVAEGHTLMHMFLQDRDRHHHRNQQ